MNNTKLRRREKGGNDEENKDRRPVNGSFVINFDVQPNANVKMALKEDQEEKEEVEEEEKEEVEEFGRTGGLHVREQEIADESSKELGTTA